MSCTLKNGKTILFWSDKWTLEVLSLKWPFLFTFVKDASQSVWDVVTIADAASLFHLPLSVQAMAGYHKFVDLIQITQLSQEMDNWTVPSD
jgi:hypothetical protein